MERTIKVFGRANQKVKADYVTLAICLQNNHPSQAVALEQANHKVALLNEKVLELGFALADLKLNSFEVNPEYKWENNTRNLTGYMAEYRFELSFDFDSQRLQNVFIVLSQDELNCSIDTTFKVKDEETVKMQILQQLTKDAFQKAQQLAVAANVTLGPLVHLDYQYEIENIVSPTNYRLAKAALMDTANAKMVQFTPMDVTIEDSAELIWEIK